jgi:uncharacterized DUF497 family protein
MARWIWDGAKAAANRAKHQVSFDLAERIFGDPLIATRPDPHPEEERWQSIGRPSGAAHLTLFVVHTAPMALPDGEEQGRIISARRATPHERRAYEAGQF